ncbi:acyltransferase family protein [Pararhodobacter sp. CCB-MM2]|uniref:acyltransferase family protein n=1 Tax=Pararhodobacter sp. CCB-MM2 TaxID=1786003 RepID=UPI00082FDF90|nr:acyltransferase family protein [Pararhodobacter sp. CCB-MM2]
MTRIHAVDLLKILIASCVVWAHAVLLGGHITPTNYLIGQGLVRNAVPCFALISGFLYFGTRAKGNTRRWLTVLTCAYLFWALVYLPIWLDGTMSMRALLGNLVFGPIHLWYMAALILAVGMLHAVLSFAPNEDAAHRWLKITAVAGILCGFSLQAVDFFSPLDLPLNAYRNGAFLEYPYAAIGYLIAAKLRREGLESLPRARTLWLIVAGLAVLRMGEALLSLQFAGLSPAAPPEFPPLAVGFIIALFLAVLRSPVPPMPPALGLVSMFIYFLHYLVLLVMLYLGLNQMWVMVPAGIVLPTVAALVLVRLLREPMLPRLLRNAFPSRHRW